MVMLHMVRKNVEHTSLWILLSQKTLSKNPLIVSVLRGQRVIEYDDIVSDPSTFAVILCTPDMVFSRLLGRNRRLLPAPNRLGPCVHDSPSLIRRPIRY